MARKRRRDPTAGEDPFIQWMLRAWTWVEHNARTAIVGLVLVGVLVGGFFYWRSYRESVRQQSAAELQDLQGRLLTGEIAPEAAQEPIQAFIDRYGGTEAADEARLLLARLYLRTGRPGQAVTVLSAVEERSPGTPIGYGAHNLMAKAREAQGEQERALEVLADIAEGARYGFQRDQARADRARILADMGRLEEAAEIYASLAEGAETTALRGLYAVRLGEIRARAATGGPEAAAGTSDTAVASDTAGDADRSSVFDTMATDTSPAGTGRRR